MRKHNGQDQHHAKRLEHCPGDTKRRPFITSNNIAPHELEEGRKFGEQYLNYLLWRGDTIAARAKRLCDALECAVFRFDGELIHLVALANVLYEGVMRARFHAEPRMQATELLLQERTPRDVLVARPRVEEVRAVAAQRAVGQAHGEGGAAPTP